MELWKIHKYCERADLDELLEREAKLIVLLQQGRLKDTNALKALELMQEYIELKKVFQD